MIARSAVRLGALSALALGLSHCTTEPARGARDAHWDGVTACEYRVQIARPAPLLLDVAVSCNGKALRGLEADDRRVAARIGAVNSSLGATTRQQNAFLLPRPTPRATFRYRVELGVLAHEAKDLNLATESRDSLLATAASFLLYPLPLDEGIEVKVWVDAPRGTFSSALAREGDHFRLEAHEIAVATYSAFGKLRERQLSLNAAKPVTIDLTVLDGELSLDLDTLSTFTTARAASVAEFFHGFPAERAAVIVLPVPGRKDLVFGKLLPESAPGVVLLVGSEADSAALADDWLLVHELFHIGVPSFFGEGKWFDEGLATYFEPIIRARAGFYDEARAWAEFASQMPRGLAALTEDGLEHARGNGGIYWGGAIFCLLADVEARTRSGGAVGLEDGLRRVLAAGGRASEVWALKRALSTADGAFAQPVLVPLADRFASRPAPLDLNALFAELGVRRTKAGVEFDDRAPLAAVRRAIFTPPVNSRSASTARTSP